MLIRIETAMYAAVSQMCGRVFRVFMETTGKILKTAVSFLLVLTLLCPVTIRNTGASELDKFNDDIRKKREDSSKKRNSGGNDALDGIMGAFLAPMLDAVLVEAGKFNMLTGYDSYPYATESESNHGKYPFVTTEHRKKWMCDLSTSYHRMDGETFAADADIHAKFMPIFGPEINYTFVRDRDDTMTIVRAGINYTWIQFGGYLFDSYFQYSGMRGDNDMNGMATGFMLRMYPYKPYTVCAKLGWDIYPGDIVLTNVDVTAGVLFNRFEFFVGYETLISGGAMIDGNRIGITVHL